MQRETNTDLKVGITVLAGILILLFGIGWAKGWKFGLDHTLLAKFHDAGGTVTGDAVYIAGIKRGKIGTIVARQNDILIELVLDEDVPLHKDATASIMMLELMGGKKIEIDPGTTGVLDPKLDTLPGINTGDLSTLVAVVSSLTDDITSVLFRADTLLGSLNEMLGDPRVRKGVPEAIAEAKRTLADISTTMRSVNSVIEVNKASIRNIARQTDELTSKLNTTIDDIGPKASSTLDSVKIFLTQTRGFIGKTEGLVNEINSLVVESREKKGLLWKLTADDKFSRRIDSLVNELDKFIRQVRRGGLDANIRLFHSSSPDEDEK